MPPRRHMQAAPDATTACILPALANLRAMLMLSNLQLPSVSQYSRGKLPQFDQLKEGQ